MRSSWRAYKQAVTRISCTVQGRTLQTTLRLTQIVIYNPHS